MEWRGRCGKSAQLKPGSEAEMRREPAGPTLCYEDLPEVMLGLISGWTLRFRNLGFGCLLM